MASSPTRISTGKENAFASAYYGEDGLYLADYAAHFGHLMYIAPESDHDFQAYSAMLDTRLASGKLRQPDI